MALTDRGLPTVDPHTTIKNLIETNMDSPDGVWNPVVNQEWLEFKKQKTYQICITPVYGETTESELNGIGGQTQIKRTNLLYMKITLFAPTRIKLWGLATKFMLVMNNGTLCYPTAGIETATGNGYQYIRIARSDETKAVKGYEPDCGPEGSSDKCVGFRNDYTVEMRFEE